MRLRSYIFEESEGRVRRVRRVSRVCRVRRVRRVRRDGFEEGEESC